MATGRGPILPSELGTRDGRSRESFRSRARVRLLEVEANHRLTVLVSLTLLPLLIVESVTGNLHRRPAMLPWHVLVGLWLLPVVAVKLGSTGYKFLRYYTREAAYFHAGPPRWIPRLIAPLLVVTTGGLFVSGVTMWAVGSAARNPWRGVHQVFFFSWLAIILGQLVFHVRQTVVDGFQQLRDRTTPARTRTYVTVGALFLGLVLGLLAL